MSLNRTQVKSTKEVVEIKFVLGVGRLLERIT